MLRKEKANKKEGELAIIVDRSIEFDILEQSLRGENWLEYHLGNHRDSNRSHYVGVEDVDGQAFFRVYVNGVEEGDKIVSASCIAYPRQGYLGGEEIKMNGELLCKVPKDYNTIWIGDGGTRYVFLKDQVRDFRYFINLSSMNLEHFIILKVLK